MDQELPERSTSCQCHVDGMRSNFVPWDSEFLGPELFVLYISDLPQQPTSRLRLFVDDTICQCPISTAEDQAILQNDLNNFCMGNEKADGTCASTWTDVTSKVLLKARGNITMLCMARCSSQSTVLTSWVSH